MVVVWYSVTSTVGNKESSIYHCHLLGLIAHCDGVHLLQGERIYLIHTSQGSIARHHHGSYIGAHIGKPFVKGEIATVGNIYLAYLLTVGSTRHLHLVGAVDHEPQTLSIDFDVVAHIAQLLHLRGITLGEDVPVIGHGTVLRREVEIIHRGFVASHVPFTQYIESSYAALIGGGSGRLLSITHHHQLIFAA